MTAYPTPPPDPERGVIHAWDHPLCLPMPVALDPGLHPKTKAVILALGAYWQSVPPLPEDLAGPTGLSYGTVIWALRQARAAGWAAEDRDGRWRLTWGAE